MLALLATLIVCFGAWEIHNAQPTEAYWQKQLIGLGIALVAMLAIAFTDYRRLVELAPVFYVFGLLLLLIVLIPGIGMRVNGQRCWIKLPGLGQFQPSEFVKIPVVLMLARYFGKHRQGALSWREVIVGLGILGLPMGLIMLEPDMGQCLTYLPLLAIVIIATTLSSSPPPAADQTAAAPPPAPTTSAPATPTQSASPTASPSPTATGSLLTDGQAGLSYTQLSAPWQGASCPPSLDNGAFPWTAGEYAPAGQVNGGSATWYGEACSGLLPQQYGYGGVANLQSTVLATSEASSVEQVSSYVLPGQSREWLLKGGAPVTARMESAAPPRCELCANDSKLQWLALILL